MEAFKGKKIETYIFTAFPVQIPSKSLHPEPFIVIKVKCK